MDRWVNMHVHNIPREAAGVGGCTLYQIDKRTNPSVIPSGSSFQNKRTLELVL